MDSAVREISSSAPAEASVEPMASPQNATATPAINCRRVGRFTSTLEFFFSLIIVLQIFCVQPSSHKSTARKYVQDNLFLEKAIWFGAYFCAWIKRRPHALPHRSPRSRQEKHH